MIALAFWIVVPIVLCHVCSLLEATLLSIRTESLLGLERQGSRGAAWLAEVRRSRVTDAISAILTVNTLAGTIGAGFAGVQAAHLFGEASVGPVSVVLTVLLLFLSEILPKTFAATHAVSLAGITGYCLHHLMILMAPFLVLTRALTRRVGQESSEGLTRRELAALISSAPNDGAISKPEADLLASMIYAQEVTLADVHTPAGLVFMMAEDATVGDLLASEEADAFSRIPLYRGTRSNVVGYIAHRDVLKQARTGRTSGRRLGSFAHALPELSAGQTVRTATLDLLSAREAIAQVRDVGGRFIGIVTLEDLLEALIGIDITDEAESVAALRRDAERLRRRRTKMLRGKRGRWVEREGGD
jgi:CBS domain containing-hemolysin-like protein